MSLRSLIRTFVPQPLRQRVAMTQASLQNFRYSLGERTETCQVRGKTIKLSISSDIEEYRAQSYSTKEPETLDWLDRNLRDDDVLFDIGANVGLYSLYSAVSSTKARVFAFEPESQNFARLCKNILLNSALNIVPCSFPLSDAMTFDYFYINEFKPGCAFHGFGAPNEYSYETKQSPLKQGALAVSIDHLVSALKVPAPTLIKIDVDGLEEKILAGAQKTLASTSLRTILVEITNNGGEAERVMEFLSKNGFYQTAAGKNHTMQSGATAANLIFERKQ